MKNSLFLFMLATLIMVACKPKSSAETTPETTNITSNDATKSVHNPTVQSWMSWEGGVDVAAVTDTSFKMPNVIVHVARMVNTPVGNAPSGMILYQPDATKPPVVMGFVSTDKKVGAYFGPKIFAGTPFEKAPVLEAAFDIQYTSDKATAKVTTSGHVFEVEMTEIGAPYLINRAPAQMPPFHQQGVECAVGKVSLKVDGKAVNIIIPPIGITGGPGAVVSPNGVYAR
ncbi:MAG: hypothetical protein R2807_07630 [Chitinophagales bacterium]